MLDLKLLLKSKGPLITIDNALVGVGNKGTDHVQKYELHSDYERVDAYVSHTIVVFNFAHTGPLFQQKSPECLKRASTLAELDKVASELNLKHDDEACEKEHEDNREVDKLILWEFDHIEEHSDLSEKLLNEVQELEDDKGGRESLAISVSQQLKADLVQNVVLTRLNEVAWWSWSLCFCFTHETIDVLSKLRIIIQDVDIKCTGKYLGVMVYDLHPVDCWIQTQSDDKAIENIPGVLEVFNYTPDN